MSEKSTPRVSVSKSGAAGSGSAGSSGSAGAAAKPTPPRQVLLAVGALALCVLASLGAAASLFGAKDWLYSTALDANKKLKAKDRKSVAELMHQVNVTPGGQLIQTGVLCAALVFVALSAYRGRYWARWGVLGLWVLSTFLGTIPGFVTSVLGVTSSSPIIFKLPSFVSGLAFIAAVILVCLRPSVEYFNRSRPVRPGGAPARRGLFAPRQPIRPRSAGGAGTRAATRPADTRPAGDPDRSKSKQRANTDAVAKGADLARSRAKAASKSRRTAS